ncbi:hypothetical protein V2J09_013649 [Rumex salicifolius]
MDCLLYTKAALPFAAMVAVEIIEMGLVTLSKAAMTRGMNNYVFVVYYNALGTLILLPFFVRHYLSGKRPLLTFHILYQLFLLGFIGICLLHICLYAGIRYIPPALAASIGNMIPAFIFLLAIIFRMEKLEIRKAISQVKVLGTIVSIAGVFIVTFYKGPSLLTSQTFAGSAHSLLSDQSKWSLGCLIIAMTCLLASIRVIFQAAIVKEFQDEMTIVFFFSLFGTIQSAIVSFFLVENSSSWKMTRRVEIISVVYAVRKQLWSFVTQKAYEKYMALTITILYNCVVTWCLRIKGPVYVAMFKPLSIAIAAVMEFLFLGETLYLGSVTGTIIIVAGFYAFMWAKTKENNNAVSEVCNLDSREIVGEQRKSIMENSSLVWNSLPFVGMIAAQFVLIGSVTLAKASLMSGLSQYVYIVYHQALATIILIPWLLCRRLSGKTLPLTFPLLCRFFGLALIGSCLSPILLCTGLNYTSVTVVSSIGNMNPIFTFLFAICLRMERLDFKKCTDQIKAFGILVAVLGAFVVTLYKGPTLLGTRNLVNSSQKLISEQPNWLLGCILITVGFVLRAIWNIFQAVSLSVLNGTIVTWCLCKKGPVFVSMFDPLNVALSAFTGFVFLTDGIYLGSVIGSTVIIVGLYAVLWGQSKTTSAMAKKIGGAFVVTLYKGSNFVGTRDSVNSSPKLISEQPNWPLDFYLDQFGHPSGKWKFNSSVEIIVIAFSLCVVISTLLTWCLREKGLVFVSMFDTLNIALAAFMGFVFLADGIYLGSVIGSTAIIVGFYAVMWGQAKTTKMTVCMAMDNKIGGLESGSSTSHVTPLCSTAQVIETLLISSEKMTCGKVN